MMCTEFYRRCAEEWGVSLEKARLKLVNTYYCARTAAPEAIVAGTRDFDRIARLLPLVLDVLPVQARYDAFRDYGIVLGDN